MKRVSFDNMVMASALPSFAGFLAWEREDYCRRDVMARQSRTASLMERMDGRHFRSDESGQVGEEEEDGY